MTAFHHTASKQLKNFFDTTRLTSSAQKNEYCIQQIGIHYSTQFGIPCNNVPVKEGVNHLRTSCYLRQMPWCHHQTATIRKAVGKASSSSSKEEWKTYSALSADQLLMIWPTVVFWRGLRTSGNANDELLAKTALCMWCYFVCTTANTVVF